MIVLQMIFGISTLLILSSGGTIVETNAILVVRISSIRYKENPFGLRSGIYFTGSEIDFLSARVFNL
jgi:hypothetical protein